MEVFAKIGGGAYCAVAFVIGLRLIALSLRTRQLPELLIGTGVFLLAGLAYPMSATARETVALAESTRSLLGASAGLLAVVGVSANTAFTWVIFRRGVAWANALLVGVSLGSLVLFVVQSLLGGWTQGFVFWTWLPLGLTLSFGWAFVECGRYHLLLRRRQRVGLADPIVTDRFALYATATALGVVTNLVGWAFWLMHLEMINHPVGGPVLFVLGASSSVLMLLAFLPPRAYLAWVSARAQVA